MKERLCVPPRSFMLREPDREAPMDRMAITHGVASNEGCGMASILVLSIRDQGVSPGHVGGCACMKTLPATGAGFPTWLD
jgi:hypothetical protein